MSHLFSTGFGFQAYNFARKWLTLMSLASSPITFFIDAPFGRFAPKNGGPFVFDGRKAWIAMEIMSPIMFLYAFLAAPLSQRNPGLPSLTSPRGTLAALFLVHYINRAIISPLRTPSRSKSHVIVNLMGAFVNTLNGFAIGAHLSSPFTILWFQNPASTQRLGYKLGLPLWIVGFVGNIVHDEILLNIRRKANQAGKARVEQHDEPKQEYYGIPYGLLYKYISYPNYFCEWVEWFGFALAAGPLPFHLSWQSISLRAFASALSPTHIISLVKTTIQQPADHFAPNLSPPWIFFLLEVVAMFPRAYRGHRWYRRRFGDSYPKERKIVVPFLI